jgi:tRNA(adenine34) deaminase
MTAKVYTSALGQRTKIVAVHEPFMRLALDEARRAEAAGEVPIGAVVVLDGQVIGRGSNRPISDVDPTAHAEILALREAARAVNNYRIVGADVYVTLEPCLMCVGALVLARVRTVVFGAREPKTGALFSTTQPLEIPTLNHRFEVVEGVLEEECRGLVQVFFRTRRSTISGDPPV